MQTEATLTYALTHATGVDGVVVSWRAALDNHSPAREEAHGYAVRWTYQPTGRDAYTIWATDFGKVGSARYEEVRRCGFVIDDGIQAQAYYVAAFGMDEDPDGVLLLPFPNEYHADGKTRRTSFSHTTGRQEPVDVSGWMAGPRKTYHLKVRPIPQR